MAQGEFRAAVGGVGRAHHRRRELGLAGGARPLWATLVRFDAVYHGHFKCNRSKLSEMPVLWAYARDLFQTPGFGDTIDLEQIKQHYYGVHRTVNPTGIVPLGPDPKGWLTPHGREELGGRPFGDGTPPGPPPEAERVPAL